MRRIQKPLFCVLAVMALMSTPRNAAAQATDPFLGQIMWAAFNFPPKGWARCDGQILAISQNTALFALLGTNFGGNGITTFALPDMRGRFPMHDGTGPGLTPRTIGEQGGQEQVTLAVAQMPTHSHTLVGSSSEAASISPAGTLPATKSRVTLYSAGPADTAMAASAIEAAGGNAPHNNMPPYTAIQCFIAVQGVFPSRN